MRTSAEDSRQSHKSSIRCSHRKGLYADEDFQDEREAITEEAQQLQEEAQRLKDGGYSEEQD